MRPICLSHFTGRPSYTCPLVLNRSNSLCQTLFPLLASMNVCAFPIIMRPSRARERRTLTRSGEDMKPIFLSLLLRVSDEQIIVTEILILSSIFAAYLACVVLSVANDVGLCFYFRCQVHYLRAVKGYYESIAVSFTTSGSF